MDRALLDRLQAARAAKEAVALVTELATGRQALSDGSQSLAGEAEVIDGRLDAVADAIAADRSSVQASDGGELFIQVFNPPLRLIVVGAVHISQALAPMAALAGYDVTIVDPRSAWANEARFPNLRLVKDWPDEALEDLAPDHRTAVVTLTHDPKLDDPALEVALRTPVFYIGCLGSKKTHAGRLGRLNELGFDDADFARLHGPIGLAIGAKSPAEIAVAILAQMTQVLHGAPALVRASDADTQPIRRDTVATLPL